MKLFLIIMVVLLCSCGKKGGGSSSSKSLFSIWTREDKEMILDLRSFAFGVTKSTTSTFADGSICNMDITISGSKSSALGLVANSSYQGGSGPGDPGCAALDGIYHLSVKKETMVFCDPPTYTDCANYY